MAGLRAIGVPERQIAQIAQAQQSKASAGQAQQAPAAGSPTRSPSCSRDFEVWDENWDVWTFFLAVDTQWLTETLGEVAGKLGSLQGRVFTRRTALSAVGVESSARLMGVSARRLRRYWPDLLVIQQAVVVAEARLRAKHFG